MRLRLLVRWLLNALALFGISYAANNLGVLQGFGVDGFGAAVIAVAILALLNLTVRPLLKLLALPITCLTFGLFTLVINAAMMWLTSQFVTGFHIGTFWNAILASLAYAILSAILNKLFINEDDDD